MGAAGSQFAIMCRENQGRPVCLVQLKEEIGNRLGVLEVEIASGFVGEENARLARECAGDRDPLLFAARKASRFVCEPMGQTNGGQGRLCPLAGVREVADLKREGDIVERRQGWQQVKRLEHEADGSEPEI